MSTDPLQVVDTQLDPLSSLLHVPAAALVNKSHLLLSDDAFKNGLHVVAGPGSGKSRLLGRLVVWQWLLRERPAVILDPTGGVRSNLLDKVIRLPRERRQKLWPRLVYVDAGATDFIVPTPVYLRHYATDTGFAVANRLLSVWKRQDPQLQSAPILGWNSLFECGIHAGKIAIVLGRQIDFVADLIAQPRVYKDELRQVLAAHPELEPDVLFFREMMDPSSANLREKRTGSFANKLLTLLADPTMLATFGASQRGVDWERVVKHGQTVLLDFADELDPERRQFKLLWWFRDFIEFIERRGLAGRGQEVLFVIDEVTQLLGQRTGAGHSVMADDLEKLVAVLSRNYGANTVIAHQNLSQVDEKVNNVLMQMGTQMIGHIANPDDALYLARQFFRYDPYWVKKEESVWMNLEQYDNYGYRLNQTFPTVIDTKEVEFTPEEQLIQAIEPFRTVPKFEFFVRPALAEGQIGTRLKRVSIANVDKHQYPDEAQVAQVRSYLRQKWGIPLETLLAEIRRRKKGDEGPEPAQALPPKLVKPMASFAILKGEEDNTDATPSHDLPVTPTSSASAAETALGGNTKVDPFWR